MNGKYDPLTASAELKTSAIASRLGATSLRELDKFATDRGVGIDPSASSPHGRRCIDVRSHVVSCGASGPQCRFSDSLP
jgi:hypothetical protein